jgi:hypothetical protein
MCSVRQGDLTVDQQLTRLRWPWPHRRFPGLQLGKRRPREGCNPYELIAHYPVAALRPFSARLGEAAHHLGGVAQCEVGPAGVHALGGERDVEVSACRETGLLEDRVRLGRTRRLVMTAG